MIDGIIAIGGIAVILLLHRWKESLIEKKKEG